MSSTYYKLHFVRMSDFRLAWLKITCAFMNVVWHQMLLLMIGKCLLLLLCAVSRCHSSPMLWFKCYSMSARSAFCFSVFLRSFVIYIFVYYHLTTHLLDVVVSCV